MAAKWTFDGPNKLFIVKSGVTQLDVQVDLYSSWKQEVKLSDNLKWAPAMRTIGGDPTTLALNAGDTYFMINGWRIRPQEANHTLNVDGNLFTDPPGFSTFVDTVGAFNVRVEMFLSNIIDGLNFLRDQIDLARKIMQNKFITDPTTGIATIHDDDGTPLLTGDLFEDAAGTIPYKGEGAERRERLE